MTQRRRRRARPSERGMALVMALFTVTALLLAATGALLVGSADMRATRNYRGAAQVHFAAESGILDALQNVNGAGIISFQNDVVNQWSNTFGTAARSFGPFAGFTYTVSPILDAANPANSGYLVATANGTESTRNVVVARVTRSNIPSTAPGAIYLASDSPTNATFNGNAFAVDGNDHNYTGGAGPGTPVPGISTRNDTNAQETIASLSAQQKDNVTGQNFSMGPPIVPSVTTSPAAPTMTQMNALIADLLAKPRPPDDNSSRINGNQTYGTVNPMSPQITHLTNTGGVTLNGNASGAGIMIVEGDLTIQGSFDFVGLLIVRGRTNVAGTTDVTGNATVYGSIWTQDINLVVGGSALVYYSSQALGVANNVSGGGALPAPVNVASLADCAEVPPATGGCP